MNSENSPWLLPDWQRQTQLILRSYARWLGKNLISPDGSLEDQSRRLFEAPFVVVSHGKQTDPVLNYGNRTALRLWEMDLPTFVQTPSRYTAEPLHRDERARLLERTTQQGYVDDYSGIRISSSGKRFRIDQAVVWNLMDEQEQPAGQAATFTSWVELPPNDPTESHF